MPLYPIGNEEKIAFSPSELVHDRFRYEQPLIIKALTFDIEIRGILINTGAGYNFLFYSCFKAIGLTDAHLTPTSIKLEGFTTHLVAAKGSVKLSVTLGEGRTAKTATVEFIVMDLNSSYN